jgi:hypothetical protein
VVRVEGRYRFKASRRFLCMLAPHLGNCGVADRDASKAQEPAFLRCSANGGSSHEYDPGWWYWGEPADLVCLAPVR